MYLEQQLDQSHQTSRKSVLAPDSKSVSKIRTVGGQGTPYGASPYQSPAGSPFGSRRQLGVVSSASDEGVGRVTDESLEQNPLLLARVSCARCNI